MPETCSGTKHFQTNAVLYQRHELCCKSLLTPDIYRARMDLLEQIDWSSLECLNASPDHSINNALKQVTRVNKEEATNEMI